MNKKELVQINIVFNEIIDSIIQSYGMIDDKEELNSALMQLEMQLVDINSISKSLKTGEVSISEFKKLLLQLVNKETNQLIVVDNNFNEMTDEEKELRNDLVIKEFSEQKTIEFTQRFYKTLSDSRILVWKSLNPQIDFFVKGQNIMSTRLSVFDEKGEEKTSE